jgi:hypothetical protein
VAIALCSLGCLGSPVLSVVLLGVALYAIGDSAESDGPVFKQPLVALMPAKVGSLSLEDTESLDADTIVMFGAIDALSGKYSGDIKLLLLNYRSPALAAEAIDKVSVALFLPRAGWELTREQPAQTQTRVTAEQKKTGRTAIVRPHGSLLLIIEGEGTALTQFDSLIAAQLIAPAGDVEAE